LKEMDAAYDEAGDLGTVYDDEESEDYFNRFIAGDRWFSSHSCNYVIVCIIISIIELDDAPIIELE